MQRANAIEFSGNDFARRMHPLRVSDGDTLTSAPITFYDSMIMSCATDQWQKASRVLGEASFRGMDDSIMGPGDVFLKGRMLALAKGGRLEVQGDLRNPLRDSRVRLATAR